MNQNKSEVRSVEGKTILKIEAKVSSFDEGKELLEKLEVLENKYKLTISLTIEPSQPLFQVNPE